MGNWKSDYIATKFSPDVIPDMKREFAKLLAKHNRNSDKAFVDPKMDIIFKFDVSAKLYAKNNWIFDNEVIEMTEHFLDEGVKDILPSKEKVAQLMFSLWEDTVVTRDRILALKEYAELMGYTTSDKENTGGAVQNVILVTDNGDNLTWEEKMRQQQHALKAHAEELLAENE